MMDQEIKMHSMKTMVVTGNVVKTLRMTDGEMRYLVGRDAVKVTIETDKSFTAEEILESLKDVFLRTTQCFEQFL